MSTDSGEPDLPTPLTEEQRAQQLSDALKRHADQLSEFFTSVQIVCTSLEPDGATRRFEKGSGDYYARMGAVRDWLRASDRVSNKEEEDDDE